MNSLLYLSCSLAIMSGVYSAGLISMDTSSQIMVGNHQINVFTEPFQKLIVDGKQVNLSTAGIKEKGEGFTIYSDFPNLPGLSVRFFDKGGYTVFFENNGVVSKVGTLSAEEEKALNDQLAQTFQNVNNQINQVQKQVEVMMKSLNSIFSRPGWPFI